GILVLRLGVLLLVLGLFLLLVGVVAGLGLGLLVALVVALGLVVGLRLVVGGLVAGLVLLRLVRALPGRDVLREGARQERDRAAVEVRLDALLQELGQLLLVGRRLVARTA